MNLIRAVPGDAVIVTQPGEDPEAWFATQLDCWYLLVSITDGSFHPELASLVIRDLDEFHIHLSRIFTGCHVRVVRRGSARVNLTILTTEVNISQC